MAKWRFSQQRRSRLEVEALEPRQLLAGIPFNFAFNDPGGLFTSFPLLMNNLQAAGQIWTSFLGGRGSLEVEVIPDNTIPRATGGTVGVQIVTQGGGFTTLEHNVVTEARTGVDPNGSTPDIRIRLNTQNYLPNVVWFDPSGVARTGMVPSNRTDFISVALHEIGHALGIQGYRDISGASYGTFTTPCGGGNLCRSTYDALTNFGTGGVPEILYFNGTRAVSRYGRPVPLTSVGPSAPLTSQNFFHLGNPVGMDGADLIPDLMNGVVFSLGTRYSPSELDLAIYADLGWTSPSRLQFSTANFNVNENAGQATVTVTRTDGGYGAVSVSYATTGGSATAGDDYTSVSGTLSWADGDTASKTFTIPITDDVLAEGNETIQLALSNPTPVGIPMLGMQSTATVTIIDNEPLTLQVTSFTPTSTGFIADFSQAFDPSTLNLYDGFGGTRGDADVTVVGRTTGPVHGSLVIDSSNTRFTFIRTGGLMPSGTGSEIYDVTFRSAANAFKTPGAMGTLLDGNGDGMAGDNYTTNFTVNSSDAVVVSIPDFSRGPEQPVHVSAAIAGLPIFVSNPAGITSLTLNLRYNTFLLRINGATTSIPGASASVNTMTPGVAAITFTSPSPLSGTGLTELVRLDAVVPDNALYNVKHVLNLDNITLMTSGGSVATLDDDGLHAVLYVGDTNASGGYTASDANRALQFAVGLGTGYATSPNTDPDVVSDVNSSGTSTAGDATNILRKAVGLPILAPAIIPDPPTAPSIMPGPVDPFLNIPKTFRARPGAVLTVPVNLDYSEGLQSADLAISYDAARLEVVSVQRGRLTRDFDVMAMNLDVDAGTLQLGMLRSAGVVSGRGKGSVLRITFRVKADAPTGGAIINLRRDLGPTMTQLNDGELDLIPDPSNEAGDRQDGMIQVGGNRARATTSRVDAVFADLATLLSKSRRSGQN